MSSSSSRKRKYPYHHHLSNVPVTNLSLQNLATRPDRYPTDNKPDPELPAKIEPTPKHGQIYSLAVGITAMFVGVWSWQTFINYTAKLVKLGLLRSLKWRNDKLFEMLKHFKIQIYEQCYSSGGLLDKLIIDEFIGVFSNEKIIPNDHVARIIEKSYIAAKETYYAALLAEVENMPNPYAVADTQTVTDQFEHQLFTTAMSAEEEGYEIVEGSGIEETALLLPAGESEAVAASNVKSVGGFLIDAMFVELTEEDKLQYGMRFLENYNVPGWAWHMLSSLPNALNDSEFFKHLAAKPTVGTDVFLDAFHNELKSNMALYFEETIANSFSNIPSNDLPYERIIDHESGIAQLVLKPNAADLMTAQQIESWNAAVDANDAFFALMPTSEEQFATIENAEKAFQSLTKAVESIDAVLDSKQRAIGMKSLFYQTVDYLTSVDAKSKAEQIREVFGTSSSIGSAENAEGFLTNLIELKDGFLQTTSEAFELVMQFNLSSFASNEIAYHEIEMQTFQEVVGESSGSGSSVLKTSIFDLSTYSESSSFSESGSVLFEKHTALLSEKLKDYKIKVGPDINWSKIDDLEDTKPKEPNVSSSSLSLTPKGKTKVKEAQEKKKQTILKKQMEEKNRLKYFEEANSFMESFMEKIRQAEKIRQQKVKLFATKFQKELQEIVGGSTVHNEPFRENYPREFNYLNSEEYRYDAKSRAKYKEKFPTVQEVGDYYRAQGWGLTPIEREEQQLTKKLGPHVEFGRGRKKKKLRTEKAFLDYNLESQTDVYRYPEEIEHQQQLQNVKNREEAYQQKKIQEEMEKTKSKGKEKEEKGKEGESECRSSRCRPTETQKKSFNSKAEMTEWLRNNPDKTAYIYGEGERPVYRPGIDDPAEFELMDRMREHFEFLKATFAEQPQLFVQPGKPSALSGESSTHGNLMSGLSEPDGATSAMAADEAFEVSESSLFLKLVAGGTFTIQAVLQAFLSLGSAANPITGTALLVEEFGDFAYSMYWGQLVLNMDIPALLVAPVIELCAALCSESVATVIIPLLEGIAAVGEIIVALATIVILAMGIYEFAHALGFDKDNKVPKFFSHLYEYITNTHSSENNYDASNSEILALALNMALYGTEEGSRPHGVTPPWTVGTEDTRPSTNPDEWDAWNNGDVYEPLNVNKLYSIFRPSLLRPMIATTTSTKKPLRKNRQLQNTNESMNLYSSRVLTPSVTTKTSNK